MLTTLLALAFVVTLVTPAPLRPTPSTCTCMSPKRPACEVYWQTTAIFVGEVTGIRTVRELDDEQGPSLSRIVTMAVTEEFQGLGGDDEVEVRTGAGGGDCGFDFQEGATYLVYANASAQTGRLETGICSRTEQVDLAAADLAYLRGIDAAEPVASLYGMVYRERQQIEDLSDPAVRPDPGGPVAAVDVVIEGEGILRVATADEEGWYEFEGLPRGRYDVQVVLPDVEEQERWRIRVPVTPACIWRNLILRPLPVSRAP